MTEVATPATPEVVVPPVPAATPTAAAAVEETVVLTKAQHDQLARDAARGSSNQRKADLYDSQNRNNGGHFRAPAAPVAPPTQEEMQAHANAEDSKAERGLLALVASPEFRDVFDADPTLRDLMVTNPLAVLPMFANDALDAEDAISQVKEALTSRKKPVTPPVATPAAPATPPAPPAGGINSQADAPVNEAYEAAKKNPNTEHSVAGMIAARLRK